MAWNYRIVKKQLKDEIYFEVCEVYYDEKGKPGSWSWGHNVLGGESMEDLKDTMNKIQEAMKRPVLEIVGDDEGLKEI